MRFWFRFQARFLSPETSWEAPLTGSETVSSAGYLYGPGLLEFPVAHDALRGIT